MKRKKEKNKGKSVKITGIDITDDTLTSRGGLNLFVRYLDGIEIMSPITELFGSIRKTNRGNGIEDIFKQLLCNFADGTSRHLVHYDMIKEDSGYAGVIESTPSTLMSSHVVKRFFTAFSMARTWQFRGLLKGLFIWRINLKKPDVIELFIDTMVMDNDEARRRHGVQPTYKRKKGFQPLQMIWDRYIIDAVFRGGKKHCNHGNAVENMVRDVVQKIRTEYRSDVPIIIKMDSGFFDQKLFEVFEELGVGYVVSGKLYADIKEYVKKVKHETWQQYKNKEQVWDYVEFMDKRGNWTKARRAIYCSPRQEGAQLMLEFARPDTILYTNLGMGEKIDELLAHAEQKQLLNAENIIERAHSRGSGELIHRAFKNFGHEELPFKKFVPNAAYYYCMVLAFFLFESFKEDVCSEIIPLAAYATTVRRKLIDCAAKIAKTANKIILKVTPATWKNLKFDVLWKRSGAPPQFAWA